MNRQEALKKLKKLDEQFRDEIGWDIRDEYLESLDELKEYLEKTITLAEFLNLKEDVLYTKRYNLILKKGYRKLFNLQENEKYLTIDTTDGAVFHSEYSTNISKFQAQFTLEEIEVIKKKFGVNLSIYDVVEVQE